MRLFFSPEEEPEMKPSLAAITIGSLLTVVLSAACFIFCAAMVFSLFRAEAGVSFGPVGLILLGLFSLGGVIGSSATGGYVASRLARSDSRWCASVHGLSSFALVATGVIVGGAFLGAKFTAGLTEKLGIAAGSAIGAGSMMGDLSKVQIVTDLKILKGKAVTQLAVPEKGQAPGKVLKTVSAKASSTANDKEVKAEAEAAAAKVRRSLGLAAFAFLGWLIIGAWASAWGARRDFRQRSEARAARLPAYRVAA